MAKPAALPKLRVEITLDNCADGAEQRRIAEDLRGFFAEVSSRTHSKCEVMLVDPAQIFHEKTHILNPRNLPEDKARWPKGLRQMEEQRSKGRYEVLPAGEVEKRYYDALRPLAFAVAQDKDAGYLKQHGIENAEQLHAGHLQALFSRHIATLPKDSPHRQGEAYRHYAETRADCGEEAMAHYLLSRDPAAKAEKTVNLFVSLDRGALEQVGEAAARVDSPAVQVHGVHPRAFGELAQALVDAVKTHYPECADIRFGKGQGHADAVAQSRMETVLRR